MKPKTITHETYDELREYPTVDPEKAKTNCLPYDFVTTGIRYEFVQKRSRAEGDGAVVEHQAIQLNWLENVEKIPNFL